MITLMPETISWIVLLTAPATAAAPPPRFCSRPSATVSRDLAKVIALDMRAMNWNFALTRSDVVGIFCCGLLPLSALPPPLSLSTTALTMGTIVFMRLETSLTTSFAFVTSGNTSGSMRATLTSVMKTLCPPVSPPLDQAT